MPHTSWFYRKLFVGFVLFGSMLSHADARLDALYSARRVTLVWLNAEKSSVFLPVVHQTIRDALTQSGRWDFMEAESVALQEKISGLGPQEGGAPSAQVISAITSALPTLESQSALIVSLNRTETFAELRGSLIAADGTELASPVISVQAPTRLTSYVEAGKAFVDAISTSLPFHGAVMFRQGYQLILERGRIPEAGPQPAAGQQLAMFTLEQKDGGLVLVETGIAEIERVETQILVAHVVKEHYPREILVGNKFRWAPMSEAPLVASLSPPRRWLHSLGTSRAVASRGNPQRTTASVSQSPTGSESLQLSNESHKLGMAELLFMGGQLNWTRVAASTGEVASSSAFVPGVWLRGEVWLTQRILVDAGAFFGSGSLSSSSGSLGSSLNRLHVLIGFRSQFWEGPMAPKVSAYLGYGRNSFSVDTSLAGLAPSSSTYSGLSAALELDVPIVEKFGFGVRVQGLLNPSLSEPAGTSGAVTTSATSAEFSLVGKFRWRPDLVAMGLMGFETSRAEFQGQGARPTALSAQSQSAQRLAIGIGYLF